jgi:hypothetical protein
MAPVLMLELLNNYVIIIQVFNKQPFTDPIM